MGPEVVAQGQSLSPGSQEGQLSQRAGFTTKEELENEKAGAVLPEPTGILQSGMCQTCSE